MYLGSYEQNENNVKIMLLKVSQCLASSIQVWKSFLGKNSTVTTRIFDLI